jgi:hypothetical protein
VEVIERLLRFNHPLLVAGGGGYHVENTVRGWALAWRTCCGGDEECDFGLGMGGVMLASTEWAGGLRDRALAVTTEQRQAVEPELQATIENITNNVFRLHDIQTGSGQGVTTPGRAG